MQSFVHFRVQFCGPNLHETSPKRIFRRPSYTQAMLRSYQGILPTVPASAYIDVSAQVIGDVVLGEKRLRLDERRSPRATSTPSASARTPTFRDCAVLHGMRHLYPGHRRRALHHRPQRHGARLRPRRRCADRYQCRRAEQRPHRRRLYHRRRSRRSRAHRHSSAQPGPPGVPGKVRRAVTDADLELIRMYANNYLDYTKVYLSETESS